MTAREVLLAYANDWHHADCAGNFSPFAECSCELAEWVTKAEAEATAAAEQRQSPYTERSEHERESSTGGHLFDAQCPFCFFDHFTPEARAECASWPPSMPTPASPRQGEPVERLPVLMLFEGWADLLPVGTCWRIAEVRTHVEPSGVKGELGKAQSVIRFDPAPAALSEPAEAGEPG